MIFGGYTSHRTVYSAIHDERVRAHEKHRDKPGGSMEMDGMVDAGVWPDDNSDWVTVVDPQFQQGGFVTVNLTLRVEP